MAVQDKLEKNAAKRLLGIISRFLLVMGVVLLGVYVVARVHSRVMLRMALRDFPKAGHHAPGTSSDWSRAQGPERQIDFNLWSMKRVTAFEESLTRHFDPPLAVLEIPKIGLEVPVFDGTDDLTLNRGVGRIIGTSRPGQGGNVGIAGHRDGFFRGLKDIGVGDKIDLQTPNRKENYRVDEIVIVKPNDVAVLENRNVPGLTLVTCYPFYYIGHAPQRYIVRASLLNEESKGKAGAQFDSALVKIKNQEKTR